jgi:uncharacterized integral membrane protein
MSARTRSGALTAGLILIVLGIIFLVENYHASFSAWRLIARYWPVILIIIGLRRVFLYFTWEEIPPAPDRAPYKE